MKYAVVQFNGAQYKIKEGDLLEVSHFSGKDGQEITIDKILLVGDDEKVKIGQPMVKGAKVTANLVKQFLGEKLHIFKFKAKTGYRRKTGFRPQKTLLTIEKISLS